MSKFLCSLHFLGLSRRMPQNVGLFMGDMGLPTIGFLGTPNAKLEERDGIEQSMVNLPPRACLLRHKKNPALSPGKSWNENGGRKKWSER